MSKKALDRIPSSTVTDAKELKFCVQGRIEIKTKLSIQQETVGFTWLLTITT